MVGLNHAAIATLGFVTYPSRAVALNCTSEKKGGNEGQKMAVEGAARISGFARGSLQRHNTENSKQIFPEKELRGHSLNPYIVSVRDLCIFPDRSASSAAGK